MALAAHQVTSAKREETRTKRLAILVEQCAAAKPISPLRYAFAKKK